MMRIPSVRAPRHVAREAFGQFKQHIARRPVGGVTRNRTASPACAFALAVVTCRSVPSGGVSGDGSEGPTTREVE